MYIYIYIYILYWNGHSAFAETDRKGFEGPTSFETVNLVSCRRERLTQMTNTSHRLYLHTGCQSTLPKPQPGSPAAVGSTQPLTA